MTSEKIDDMVHVMSKGTSAGQVLRDICLGGIQEEAFYLQDIGDIVRKYNEWTEKLPRVKPFYAMKCNDRKIVLQVMAALGAGFDCASKDEIDMILELGVAPDRIVFANPYKIVTHLRHAANTGVSLMAFDSQTELHKIKEIYPTARLLLRYRCDAVIAESLMGDKFGCDANTDGRVLIQTAYELGLNVVGICFHVGAGCEEAQVFRRGIAAARELFDFGATVGYKMDVVDIGGGFPGGKSTSVYEMFNVINEALDDFFPTNDVQIISEPGRYFAQSAVTLATRIHSKREVRSDEDQQVAKRNMYYIDDGIHGSFFMKLVIGTLKDVIPEPLMERDGPLISSTIWGPTCNSFDKVIAQVFLPDTPAGDWLLFDNMGSYTFATASTFNSFPKTKVYTVVDQSSWSLLQDKYSLNVKRVSSADTLSSVPQGLNGLINGTESFSIFELS